MNFQPKHLKTFWNKKNILFVSLVLAFCLVMGGTTAWLTAKSRRTQYEFEGAFVDCAVVEDFTQNTGTVKSNVKIKNTGNTQAYIRATFVASWVKDGTQNSSTPQVHLTTPQNGKDYDVSFGEGWVLKEDGYFYYALPLDGGNTTRTWITQLTKKSTPPSGYHLQVTILPEAVQTTEIGDGYYHYISFDEAWGRYSSTTQLANRPTMAEGGKPMFTAPVKEQLPLKIMTYNIRTSGHEDASDNYSADVGDRDWYDRRDELVDYLKNSGADIICLQETSKWQVEFISSQPAIASLYEWQATTWDDTSINGNYWGLMTLYRKNAFNLLDYTDFYLSDTPDTWSATWEINDEVRKANITLLSHKETKKVFCVTNTHLPYGNDGDSYQDTTGDTVRMKAQRLIRLERSKYVADFDVFALTANADPWYQTKSGTEIWYWDNGLKDVMNATAQKTLNDWAGSGGTNERLRGPWQNQVEGATDFIFTTASATVKNTTKIDENATYSSSVEDPLSCHWPVIADLEYSYIVNGQTGQFAYKELESNILSMNIRFAGDEHGNGTYAADQGNGEWTYRREKLALYLHHSNRDIICLQDVNDYQANWLQNNVNNADANQCVQYNFVKDQHREQVDYYRGLMTMYDKNRYVDTGEREIFWFTENREQGITYDDGCRDKDGNPAYHYRKAMILVLKEISTGYKIAVCNIQTDYPADHMLGTCTCTQQEKIDELIERSVNQAMTQMYALDADFYMMAGDFNTDAFRNPTWYNQVLSKMQDVLPGETRRTINDWDNRGYPVWQVESPRLENVKGPVDFIFVDKNAQVYSQSSFTDVFEDSFNNGDDLYSRHYAVGAKVKFKNY